MECLEKSDIIVSIRAFLPQELSFVYSYLVDRTVGYIKRDVVTIPDEAGFEIIFSDESASIKEEQQVTYGGYVYKNTIEFSQPQSFEDYSDVLTQLSNLQRHAHHILITYFGGQQKLVRVDPLGDGYMFSYKQSGLTTECTITINNISGIRNVI